MPSKVDHRYKQIGSRKRAQSRYAMIKYRLAHTDQKKNSCYAGVQLKVSEEEFVKWFMENDFSGCSVDRIDPSKDYEIGNLQLIPQPINSGKDKIIAVDGKCRCFRCGVTKLQAEFVKDSRRSTGYSTVCKPCERERTAEKKVRLGR